MINLIGELPDSRAVLKVRDAHLHLYGKTPRSGRKVGHVTVRAAQHEDLKGSLHALPGFFKTEEYCLDAILRPRRDRI